MKRKLLIALGVLIVSGLVFAAVETKFYGNINMQNNKILNVATDNSTSSATTKGYVDTAISGLSSVYLPRTGGTMSGTIYMGSTHQIKNLADPTASQDGATKSYVDNADLTKLSLSGGIMLGDLDMGYHYITNVHAPRSGALGYYDVVNKIYAKSNFLPLDGTGAIDTNLHAQAMSGSINMGNHQIFGVPSVPDGSDRATSKAYVDKGDNANKTNMYAEVGKKLNLSGGTMTGDISMGSHKISSLATPTASADATTKAYVDTLVYNSPSLIDSFQFYTLESGITNVARIFEIDSTGGYIRVSMLADNAAGQYGMTATLSDTNDNVQIEQADVLSKAGQGFKLWLTSNQTNDHYTSIKVRDDGNGCGVALARIKSVEAPDWDLYVCSNTSVPAENRFSYKYTQEMMYDIHKAYYSGVFAFVVGVSNTTSRTIKCSVGGEAQGFYTSASYALSFVGPTTLTIPPHSCSFVPAYITEYDDNTGASIILSIANSVLMKMRDYRTYWSWSGMQP